MRLTAGVARARKRELFRLPYPCPLLHLFPVLSQLIEAYIALQE
jgi:hypothetical protein